MQPKECSQPIFSCCAMRILKQISCNYRAIYSFPYDAQTWRESARLAHRIIVIARNILQQIRNLALKAQAQCVDMFKRCIIRAVVADFINNRPGNTGFFERSLNVILRFSRNILFSSRLMILMRIIEIPRNRKTICLPDYRWRAERHNSNNSKNTESNDRCADFKRRFRPPQSIQTPASSSSITIGDRQSGQLDRISSDMSITLAVYLFYRLVTMH